MLVAFTFTTSGITLNGLREQNPDLFIQEFDPWWKGEPFANNKGMPLWPRKLALRTAAIPDSFNRTWDEQQKLLASGENVPTVRDLVEGMIAYYDDTGEQLFSDYWVRTSDISLMSGDRVSVKFSTNVVEIASEGDYRDSWSGVTVVYNPRFPWQAITDTIRTLMRTE